MADNIGGGNPGGAEGGAPGAGGGNTNPNPNPNPGGQPGVGGAGGSGGQGGGQPGGAEKVYTYKEDRTDWVPRTRLNEESGKRTKIETDFNGLKSQLEQANARIRALAGVEPTDPKAVEAEEIKGAILTMFPGLKAWGDMSPEQLQEILSAASAAQNTSRVTWERHTQTILSDLSAECARGLNESKLSPSQERRLHRAYREEAMDAMAEREAAFQRGDRPTLETIRTDTDFIARHERGDKALITEFVKNFLGDWYEPARKSVTIQQQRRALRPTPRGERTRVLLGSGEQKVNLDDKAAFKKALLDARAASE